MPRRVSGNWKRIGSAAVLLMWNVTERSVPRGTSPRLSSSGAGGRTRAYWVTLLV